jgi:hypothetical protein
MLAQMSGGRDTVAAMKKILPTVLVILGLAAAPAFAQSSGGKSGGDEASLSLGGGKGTDPGPGVAAEGEIVAGNDANRAVENIASPVDPLGDPAGFIETLVTWWKAGYLSVFFLAVAYGLVLVAARYVPLFQNGKWALGVAVGAAFLGDLVTRLSTGTPVTIPMLIAAAGVAWAVYINGSKASQIATKAVDAKTFGHTS